MCLCCYFKKRARARCPLFCFFFCFTLCFLTWIWICISKMMGYAMQVRLTLSFGQCLNLPPTLSYTSLKESFLAPGKWKSSSVLLLISAWTWCWYIWSLIFSYFSPLLKSITSRADVDHAMIEEDLEERQDFIAALESRFLFLASDARSTLR